MAIISLEPKSALLQATYGISHTVRQAGEWALGFTVGYWRHERIDLATGEHRRDVEMRVQFNVDKAETREWMAKLTGAKADELSGMVTYYEAYQSRDELDVDGASIVFTQLVPPEVMAELVALARHGRYPARLDIDFEGMEYGYAPDGSHKKWDNKAKKHLAINNTRWELPLAPAQDEPLPDEPKTAVGADIAPLLKQNLKWQQWTFWLIVIVGALALYSAKA